MPTDTLILIQEHFQYILELRSKLFSVLIFFIVGAIIAFVFSNQLILMGLSLFNLHGVNVVMTSPFQFVGLSFTLSFICGIIDMF